MVSKDSKKKNKEQKLQEKDLASRYFERGKKNPPQNVIQLNRKIMIQNVNKNCKIEYSWVHNFPPQPPLKLPPSPQKYFQQTPINPVTRNPQITFFSGLVLLTFKQTNKQINKHNPKHDQRRQQKNIKKQHRKMQECKKSNNDV